MRSWIAFPLLLFFSAQSSAAAKHDKRQGVSGGNAPAALPAFSHESNKFQLHIDKETLEFVNTELGKQPKKRREKSRSSRVVDHRATDTIDRDRVDMFIEQFNRLIQEDQLVCISAIPGSFHLIGAGGPFGPTDCSHSRCFQSRLEPIGKYTPLCGC